MPRKKFFHRFRRLLLVAAVSLAGIGLWLTAQIRQSGQKKELRSRLEAVLGANEQTKEYALGPFERFDASGTQIKFIIRLNPLPQKTIPAPPGIPVSQDVAEQIKADPFFHGRDPGEGRRLSATADFLVILLPEGRLLLGTAPLPERRR